MICKHTKDLGYKRRMLRGPSLIPFPNFIAGVLIGIANSTWSAVVFIATIAWPIIYCAYVSVVEAPRASRTIEAFRQRGNRLLLTSPSLTFYAIEGLTAAITGLIIASATFGLKRLIE